MEIKEFKSMIAMGMENRALNRDRIMEGSIGTGYDGYDKDDRIGWMDSIGEKRSAIIAMNIGSL